jgi:hypothetical protein
MGKLLYETKEEDITIFEGYTKENAWGALRKLWRGFKIAKVQNDYDKMAEYAKRINTIQKELKVKHGYSNLELTYFRIEIPDNENTKSESIETTNVSDALNE